MPELGLQFPSVLTPSSPTPGLLSGAINFCSYMAFSFLNSLQGRFNLIFLLLVYYCLDTYFTSLAKDPF